MASKSSKSGKQHVGGDADDHGSKHPANATSSDYKVGYGNPPLETRFPKGNKFGKGRRTGSKGIKTIVNEAFGKKVQISSGGKTVKTTKIELTVHQLANKAAQGDLKAAEKALSLYERYGPQEDANAPEPEKLKRDLAALRPFLAMRDLIDPEEEGESSQDGDEEAGNGQS